MSCNLRRSFLVSAAIAAIVSTAASATAAEEQATDSSSASASPAPRVDWLDLARGVVPLGVDAAGADLGVGDDQALRMIDGDPSGFVATPRPGDATTPIVFRYALPAPTRFEAFAVPNVLETPSPAQTFFAKVEIAGALDGADGPYHVLAEATLQTHTKKGEQTVIPARDPSAVRWIRLTLSGGIRLERDETFFEFSEIEGYGTQEAVPLSQGFTGRWRARGVKLELAQAGIRVSGCYEGDGRLEGTVSGNLLRATGADRKSGVPSAFVLAVAPSGAIFGVRSTNGAPFRLYAGERAPSLKTACTDAPVAPLGCGSILHGIEFDYDSARIRAESEADLEALRVGVERELRAERPRITVVGHTSSEGSDAHNDALSRRRAEAVVDALVARGIERADLAADGRGERQPIADNATAAGRSLNRRVEIRCKARSSE